MNLKRASFAARGREFPEGLTEKLRLLGHITQYADQFQSYDMQCKNSSISAMRWILLSFDMAPRTNNESDIATWEAKALR